MSSGGGGGGSGTQTNITELPEWARPYAQNILAKGEALTESTTPATYGGSRYAGLSDLQKKAIESVSTPESYQKSLQGFMDPYAQNVIDIQKREANRQSQMAGLQEAGQAVKSGAFGGSRAGLVEAERARNTGQLLSDIQMRGSEAAYQNAQQALQRDIANKMQIGSMQQADIQRPMDIAYQDFLNQQNYPYKQLGFMSDLLRGTPTGSSSTVNMYQAPGSLLGQLGGLGMGAYGMSRMFAKEGGLMESDGYAEGGVTDDRNVEGILSKLSDQQLQDARNAALMNRDQAKLQMIDAEMAERASMREGLGSIPVDFAAFMPDEESYARGGIVAFAEPTEENNRSLVKDPEEATSTAGDIWRSITGTLRKGVEETAKYGQLREQMSEARPGFFESLTPAQRASRQQEVKDIKRQMDELTGRNQKKAEAKPTTVEPNAKDKEIMAKIEADQKASAAPAPAAAPKAPAKSLSEAARIVTDVAKTQVPKDDVGKLYDDIAKKLNDAPRPEAEALSRMLEKADKRAEEIKARGVSEALMKFGFGMAAAAAKPGQARRSGLAGALESAAAASPILAESIAENEKLQAAAQDNALKLRMEQARYQSALEQGNKQLAASLAGSISQRNLQQSQLEEQIAQNARANALKEKEIAGIAAYRQAVSDPERIRVAERYMAENPGMKFNEAMEIAAKTSPGGLRADLAGLNKAMELKSKLLKDRNRWVGSDSKYGKAQITEIDNQIAEIDRQYGLNKGTGVTSGPKIGWAIEPAGGR